MITPTPTYEVTNAESLNKYLMGTLTSIRRKEIAVEEADAIAKVSDKIIKNNLTRIMEANRLGDKTPIEFFAPTENKVLIG